MNMIHRCLLLIIVAELLGSGVLMARQLLRATPPEIEWALVDPVTADEIRMAATTCESAKDWRSLGERYMSSGCFVESEICHRIACEREPRNALFRRQWGFALERLGLLDEANAQYQKTMELSGSEADACRYFIGKNLLREGQPSAARTFFEDGKKLPANLYELARLQMRADELTDASATYSRLAASGPEMLQVNLLGYRLALAQGETRKALQLADKVDYSTRKLQNPFDEEAKRLFKATQKLGAGRYQARSRELIDTGRLEEAQSLLESQAAKDRSATVLELLAEIALQQKRFADALELFDELQQQHGPFPRVTDRIGDVLAAEGQSAQARESWLKAAQLQTGVDLKAIHHKLADSLAASGDEPTAKQHRALGHYYHGHEVLHRGQAAQAINSFVDAVKSDPGLTQAWFYLGESRRLTRQPEEARAAYQTCLEQNPDHGRALASLSMLDHK